MLQRLWTALSKVKAVNATKDLLNETHILCNKKIKLPKNYATIQWVQYSYKMDLKML